VSPRGFRFRLQKQKQRHHFPPSFLSPSLVCGAFVCIQRLRLSRHLGFLFALSGTGCVLGFLFAPFVLGSHPLFSRPLFATRDKPRNNNEGTSRKQSPRTEAVECRTRPKTASQERKQRAESEGLEPKTKAARTKAAEPRNQEEELRTKSRVTLFLGLLRDIVSWLVACLRFRSSRASTSRLVFSVLSARAFGLSVLWARAFGALGSCFRCSRLVLSVLSARAFVALSQIVLSLLSDRSFVALRSFFRCSQIVLSFLSARAFVALGSCFRCSRPQEMHTGPGEMQHNSCSLLTFRYFLLDVDAPCKQCILETVKQNQTPAHKHVYKKFSQTPAN
jgi:hypothetical protein